MPPVALACRRMRCNEYFFQGLAFKPEIKNACTWTRAEGDMLRLHMPCRAWPYPTLKCINVDMQHQLCQQLSTCERVPSQSCIPRTSS